LWQEAGVSEIETFLRGVELFTGLHDDEFKTLAAHAEARTYRDGEAIVRQGDTGAFVWIVREGTVEVHTHPNGRDTTVATIGPGEIFGEMSVMTGDPARADVLAKGPCHTIRIDGTVFKRIVRNNMRSISKVSSAMVKRFASIARNG
jgi:acetate kinase